MRQPNKQNNQIELHMYLWKPHIHRGLEAERGSEVYMTFWAKKEERCPGPSEGRKVIPRIRRADVQ